MRRIDFIAIFKDILNYFILCILLHRLTYYISYDNLEGLFDSIIIMSFLLLYKFAIRGQGWIYDETTKKENIGMMAKKSSTNEVKEEKETAEFYKTYITQHEAGHALMAYLLRVKIANVSVSSLSPKVITVSEKYDADEIKKNILVKYAGAAADELLFGKILYGCIGSCDADFESATTFIKAYIIMTDSTVSKSMLDIELAEKVISLSKLFYQQAYNILLENKDMLDLLTKELKKSTIMTDEQIRKFFADNGMESRNVEPQN